MSPVYHILDNMPGYHCVTHTQLSLHAGNPGAYEGLCEPKNKQADRWHCWVYVCLVNAGHLFVTRLTGRCRLSELLKLPRLTFKIRVDSVSHLGSAYNLSTICGSQSKDCNHAGWTRPLRCSWLQPCSFWGCCNQQAKSLYCITSYIWRYPISIVWLGRQLLCDGCIGAITEIFV